MSLCFGQTRRDKIKPLLTAYAGPDLLARGPFRDVYQTAIDMLAQRGLWDDADALAEVYRKGVSGNPTPHHLRMALLVAKGDLEGYHRISARLVTRYNRLFSDLGPARADPGSASLATDCLILPSSGAKVLELAAWIELGVNRGTNSSSVPNLKLCGALAVFRLGRYEEAAHRAQLAGVSRTAAVQAQAAAILAMAQFKLDQLDRARSTLADCEKVIESKLPKLKTPGESDLGKNWRDWIVAHALRSEAQRMMAEKSGSGAASPPTGPVR